MPFKEEDIVRESAHYFAISVPRGFEIYKIGVTHATKCATIGYTGQTGLDRVDAEIARREALKEQRQV